MDRAADAPTRSGATLAAAAILGVVVLMAATQYFAFQSSRAGEASFWLLAGGPLVALAVVAAWWARRRGELSAWLRPVGGDIWLGFVAAALLFGGAYEVSKTFLADGSPRAIWLARIYLQLGDPGLLRERSTLLFFSLVAVAAAEEIVWRGLVTSLLGEVLGAAASWDWVVAAILYAVAALPTMWALAGPSSLNPLLPLAALGAGLLWGGMARRWGRLPPCIVSHALFDWCVVVMFRLWGQSL